MGGYRRFANLGYGGFGGSRNSETDGPAVQAGSSKDALIANKICTGINAYQEYQDPHILWYLTQDLAEAVRLRRENSAGYGDGHIETHGQPGYIGPGGSVTWDGMGYVTYQGLPDYRFPY